MDPQDDQLTTHLILQSWEISIEPYKNWPFGSIDNQIWHVSYELNLTQTHTQCDSAELLVTQFCSHNSDSY